MAIKQQQRRLDEASAAEEHAEELKEAMQNAKRVLTEGLSFGNTETPVVPPNTAQLAREEVKEESEAEEVRVDSTVLAEVSS